MSADAGYRWDQDAEGVVTVTMDDPDAAVNTMNAHFVAAFGATIERLEAERDGITGVILASGKDSWFAGGDLVQLRQADPSRSAEETARVEHVKSLLRRLELLGRPVVATLTGSALGGGLEVALAAHRRIAASDAPRARFGLPEVSLGLLPGGGGIVRTVRMLGLQKALEQVILPATLFDGAEAVDAGIVDELVPSADLTAAARAWIAVNPEPVKPWDEKGFRIPGGGPKEGSVASMLPAMTAQLRAEVGGAPLPAPRAALAAAVEGAYLDFEAASRVETRYFIHLTHTRVAKNMISAFFDRQALKTEGGRMGPAPAARAGLIEAVAAVGEGVEPASVEQAARQAGYRVGALRRVDEGALAGDSPGAVVRADRLAGVAEEVLAWLRDETPRRGDEAPHGFYEYDEAGEPVRIRADLRERFRSGRAAPALVELQERMLFADALEALDRLDEGVFASVAEANIASLEAGFPSWTGGALQYMAQYDGGVAGFAARAQALADRHGSRFAPPPSLLRLVEDAGDHA
ncbi:enoyl-CoA hydratase/isomerase family protein [Microbacterium sp. CIAB417]|uniref:enoyl-CoA hydratase/isomerase family protein n=1 Tax=Microbacterium sp. CIAB417 TaxID=2860287 RepID=UPI001FAE674C|nr:enoyl-CoA hydratase/isomerase family protein [Microbacterium sp. CIAB417]